MSPGVDLPNPLRRTDVWRLALASGLLTCPQFAVLTFGAVFTRDQLHLGIAASSGLLVVMQVLGATSRVASGRWTDRRGGRRPFVIRAGWAAALAFVAVAVLAPLPAAIVAVLLVFAGVLASCWHGVAYAEIAEMAGAARSGTALGLENTMVFVGAFITPLIIPPLLSAGSWPLVWIAAASVPSVIAAVLVPRRVRNSGE